VADDEGKAEKTKYIEMRVAKMQDKIMQYKDR